MPARRHPSLEALTASAVAVAHVIRAVDPRRPGAWQEFVLAPDADCFGTVRGLTVVVDFARPEQVVRLRAIVRAARGRRDRRARD